MARKFYPLLILAAGLLATPVAAQTARHALSLDAAPKYKPGFKQLEYVNPTAPKGGAVKLHAIGGFDTFNPFIIKGNSAAGLRYLFEPLMVAPQDDSLTEYGLIAESVEVADDLSYVIYNLRAEARFHDGSPITAEDVIWSFKALKEKGQPFYRFYYKNVAKAEALSPKRVKFSFSGPPNRELPQIIGQLQVLSKAWWSKNDLSKTTLKPPLGSGPYRIKSFEPGRYVVYERVKDYWGRDLAINRGRFNFDTIRYDFYRDQNVAMEAFKAHLYDFRVEGSSKEWATSYNFPARKSGLVKIVTQAHKSPAGMTAFVFNTRRDKFQDPVIRQAISYAFNFEWSNKQLFYGQYTRTASYFENSELAATALPTPGELKLLEPWRGKIPDQVFTTIYRPAAGDASGAVRRSLRKALKLLRNAGWKITNNRLINPRTGKPVDIEFLLVSPAFERIVNPFIQNLKRLGITARIRTVDPAQYQNRLRAFDFDIIASGFGQSRSPGNEQRNYWSSVSADRTGSRNLIGIKDPAIDALVEAIVAARDRKSLVTATRALDRVLQWNHFVIPQWHIRSFRMAWWDRFGRPAKTPAYGIGFDSWWIDSARQNALLKKRPSSRKRLK
jgi:microcin C transport system substrate-binding protein